MVRCGDNHALGVSARQPALATVAPMSTAFAQHAHRLAAAMARPLGLDRLAPRTLAFIALVVTSALWGSNAVVARMLLDGVSPTWLAWLRWLVVVAILAPFVWHERAAIVKALRDDPRDYALFAVIGFAPQNALVYTGLAGTTAINMGLLNSVIPVLIVAIVALMKRRVPRSFEAIGVGLSMVGVLLIAVHGDLRALARLELSRSDLVVLAGMFIWAIYTVRLGIREASSPALSFPAFCFTAGLLGLVLTMPVLGVDVALHGLPRPSWGTMAGILYLGALPTLVAMLLYGYGLARVGAVQGGIFTHLVPVFSALFATLVIGERLFPFHAAGFALIAGGAILCCLTPTPVLSSARESRHA
jgi:drug/metabolite transporter (DMT)-like permease